MAGGKRAQLAILFPEWGPEPPVTEPPRKLVLVPAAATLGAAARSPQVRRPGAHSLPHAGTEQAHGDAL